MTEIVRVTNGGMQFGSPQINTKVHHIMEAAGLNIPSQQSAMKKGSLWFTKLKREGQGVCGGYLQEKTNRL